MSIESEVREYIIDQCLTESEAQEFNDSSDLLTLMDSLKILRMIVEFERRYSVKIDNSELSPENLGNVSQIAAFLKSKQHAQQN